MQDLKQPPPYEIMPDLMKDEQIAEYVRAARRGDIKNVDLVADLEAKADPGKVMAAVALALRSPIEFTTRRVDRNHLCPCGSGKKFKKCCLGHTVRS